MSAKDTPGCYQPLHINSLQTKSPMQAPILWCFESLGQQAQVHNRCIFWHHYSDMFVHWDTVGCLWRIPGQIHFGLYSNFVIRLSSALPSTIPWSQLFWGVLGNPYCKHVVDNDAIIISYGHFSNDEVTPIYSSVTRHHYIRDFTPWLHVYAIRLLAFLPRSQKRTQIYGMISIRYVQYSSSHCHKAQVLQIVITTCSEHGFSKVNPGSADPRQTKRCGLFKWSETLAHGFLPKSMCLNMLRGTASPQPLRISWSLAMAEFSVKSFALFMWWRVFEAC